MWSVADGGHEWVRDPEGRDGWFLKWPSLDLKESRMALKWKAHFYAPMQESGLFLRFAEIKPTRDGIREFANTYGLLTQVDPLGPPGEALGFWISSIRQLSHAVQLWTMVGEGDVRGLAQFIEWRSFGVQYNTGKPGFGSGWVATTKEPELIERFQKGDLVGPAWYRLQRLINEHMAENVSPRLLWDGAYSRLGLHYVPHNLISALWLQLARAVDGERVFHRCDECRNLFEVQSPEGARADKKYCGAACRARAWRKARAAK
jgi:hypothetical protein